MLNWWLHVECVVSGLEFWRIFEAVRDDDDVDEATEWDRKKDEESKLYAALFFFFSIPIHCSFLCLLLLGLHGATNQVRRLTGEMLVEEDEVARLAWNVYNSSTSSSACLTCSHIWCIFRMTWGLRIFSSSLRNRFSFQFQDIIRSMLDQDSTLLLIVRQLSRVGEIGCVTRLDLSEILLSWEALHRGFIRNSDKFWVRVKSCQQYPDYAESSVILARAMATR